MIHKERIKEIIVLLQNMSEPMTVVDWSIMDNLADEMYEACEEHWKADMLATATKIIGENK